MDLPGIAIRNYYFQKSRAKLFVHDTFGPKVEMPISLYFRKEKALPKLEKKALKLCEGKVLDIGAGAGCHSLILQEKGLDVTALEISPASCEVMHDLGIRKMVCEDIFRYDTEKYDTILLLMNGIGLCGNLTGFRKFLHHSRKLLTPDGFLLFDSSDIAYMYEDIAFPEDRYYGEVNCRYEYQQQMTEWFSWLYINQSTLRTIAEEEGWHVEIIYEDENDQYLAKLIQK